MDEGTLVEWLVAPGDEVQRGPLAESDHVELSGVHGSGPGGAITRHDVEEAAHADEPATFGPRPTPVALPRSEASTCRDEAGAALVVRWWLPTCPPSRHRLRGERARRRRSAWRGSAAGMRRAIADGLSRSKREIPHYYLSNTVDLHAATTWLDERNASRPPTEHVLPAALLLKATAWPHGRCPSSTAPGRRAGSGRHLR